MIFLINLVIAMKLSGRLHGCMKYKININYKLFKNKLRDWFYGEI
jgi:hypothetical protein